MRSFQNPDGREPFTQSLLLLFLKHSQVTLLSLSGPRLSGVWTMQSFLADIDPDDTDVVPAF